MCYLNNQIKTTKTIQKSNNHFIKIKTKLKKLNYQENTMTFTKNDYDHLFKILIIGESGVGKTCLLQRFCENSFDSNFISTIGVDFKKKMMNVEDKKVKLQIWDTAGQERFRNITSSYYRGTQGCLIVYDVNDPVTLQKVAEWFTEITDRTLENPPVIYIVGNKIDLRNGLPPIIEKLFKNTESSHSSDC